MLLSKLPGNHANDEQQQAQVQVEVLFKPGDLIQAASPALAKVLNEENKGRRCDTCFARSDTLRRCSGCSQMFYCNTKCQKYDWKEAHQLECKSAYFKSDLGRRGIGGVQFQRQICRLYAILKTHPELELNEHKLFDGTTRAFKDLISHGDYVGQQSVLDIVSKLICLKDIPLNKELDKPLGANETREYLTRLCGIWKTNAAMILNETETEPIGGGIYIQASYFDHSCRPNAATFNRGPNMGVRAIGTIMKGESPRVNYLSGAHPRLYRQEILMSRYNFNCACALCQRENESGDAMDYKLFESLKKDPLFVSWKTIYNPAQEMVKMMRQCFEEYDERISNKLLQTLEEVANLSAPMMVLKKLAKDTEDHLQVTFGADSVDMTKLKGIRKRFGIPD